MERSGLIAIELQSNHPRNRTWARKRGLAFRRRWTVMVYNSNGCGAGCYGDHPVLSKRMYKSYSDAMRAIEQEERRWLS